MARKDIDVAKRNLMEDVANVQSVELGARTLAYVFVPPRTYEVTRTNAEAVGRLIAHYYAQKYPELFDGFDPSVIPKPTPEELSYTSGGAFGSRNDY